MAYREIIINGNPVKLIPLGDCACGCNQLTQINTRSRSRTGDIKGKPKKFIIGHSYKNIFGKDHPGWKGGRIERKGYIYILCPNHPNATKQGYVCEHRLVMEERIGRYLTKNEIIHHINGNIIDNHIDNLKIHFSTGKHVILENHVGRDTKNGRFLPPCKKGE